jgi:hypothetical protein
MTLNIHSLKTVPDTTEPARLVLPFPAERLLIVVGVLGLHGLLLRRYPIIYGADPVVRLINFPGILGGHQLPLLQVLTYGVMRWYHSPTGIFMLMALISAAGCAGMHALAGELTRDRWAARLTAILYATHPFILYYSRVPYQEPLMMAGMAWGFYYLFRRPSFTTLVLSSLFLGIASLSRYEGWIAALAASGYRIRQDLDRGTRSPFVSIVQSLLVFGWAPLVWIAWNQGLSPAGSFVLDPGFRFEKLYRSYFILKSTLWWTESGVTLMAVIGFAHTRTDERLRRDDRFTVLLGSAILLLAALLFSAHGIQPDPLRLVTEREAFIPVGILLLYAGIGGSRLLREIGRLPVHGSTARLGIPALVVLASAGYSLSRGIHRVAAANDDPDLKTDYQVAQFLAKKQAAGLILAAPLPRNQLLGYLQSVERWSGPEGRRKAEQSLSGVETTPLDYQRVLLSSWEGRDKIFSADRLKGLNRDGIENYLRLNRIDYLVVFSDFAAGSEHENAIMSYFVGQRAPELEIHNGHKTAKIFPATLLKQ